LTNKRKRYHRKKSTLVVAIQLSLDTDGISYQKWGARQRAKRDDWLVSNAGDVYTVDQQTFAQTYRSVSEGLFEKVSDIWACEANEAGTVSTKEGQTAYQAGDFLVSNDPTGIDAYAISAGKFHELYQAADE